MKIHDNGEKTYETFDELLKAGIVFAAEDDENYYLRPTPDGEWDNSIYAVKKGDKKAKWMYFTQWAVEKSDSCKEIDPKNIKRG